MKRFYWFDGVLWWRTYTPGGFDGYRTLTGRRMPCATMDSAIRIDRGGWPLSERDAETQRRILAISRRRG